MEMTESNGNLSDHKSCLFIRESSDFDQMSEKLSSLNKVHQKEDSLIIFKDIVHSDNEWMLNIV